MISWELVRAVMDSDTLADPIQAVERHTHREVLRLALVRIGNTRYCRRKYWTELEAFCCRNWEAVAAVEACSRAEVGDATDRCPLNCWTWLWSGSEKTVAKGLRDEGMNWVVGIATSTAGWEVSELKSSTFSVYCCYCLCLLLRLLPFHNPQIASEVWCYNFFGCRLLDLCQLEETGHAQPGSMVRKGLQEQTDRFRVPIVQCSSASPGVVELLLVNNRIQSFRVRGERQVVKGNY